MLIVINETYFNDWLEEELNKRGWTQAELARRTNLTRSAISMLFSGKNQPKASTCLAIARAFDLPPETVLKAADLLPELPVPDRDPTLQELMDLMRRMPEEERKEILEYALWRFKRKREGS